MVLYYFIQNHLLLVTEVMYAPAMDGANRVYGFRS